MMVMNPAAYYLNLGWKMIKMLSEELDGEIQLSES